MKVEIVCSRGGCPNKNIGELMSDHGEFIGILLPGWGWSFEVVETTNSDGTPLETLANFLCPKHSIKKKETK